ncbi:hypothetical protein AAY473_014558 [Plecturocebus cupreus]
MAHACNPNTLGGQGGWITRGQQFETSLANMAKPISTKNVKISQAWWCMPVSPAIQETEARESLEPGRWRFQIQARSSSPPVESDELLPQDGVHGFLIDHRVQLHDLFQVKVFGKLGENVLRQLLNHFLKVQKRVSHSVIQVGVQRRDLSSLQPLQPRLKRSSHLSFLSSWDYRWDFAMLLRLVSNSLAQAIRPPWPPKVPGL